jgi:hypothetical protein
MSTKTLSIIIGLVFIIVGFLGFTSNPIIGAEEHSVFHTDGVHNAVHLISGALFLLFAFAIPARLSAFMKIFGTVYFLLGVLGLIMFGTTEEGKLLGFLHVNGADNFLHMGLGIIIFLAGRAKPGTAANV